MSFSGNEAERKSSRVRLNELRFAAARAWLRLIPRRLLPYVWRDPLFDRDYYLRRYPDVALSGLDPERHYRFHGVHESRDPNAFFRVAWYLATYPDVAGSRLDPLDHYFLYGADEGRDPGPRFRTREYLALNPDVARAVMNPLHHFLKYGAREGRGATGRGGAGSIEGMIEPVLILEPGRSRRLVGSLGERLGRLRQLGRKRGHQPLAVVIDSHYPRPNHDAGSVLTLNLLRLLIDSGYRVVFLPTAAGSAGSEDRERLRSLGVTTSDRKIVDELSHLGRDVDLIVLSRVDSGGRYLDAVRKTCPTARLMFFAVDLHYLREMREAEVSHDPVRMYRAMAIREREIYLSRMTDVVLVISQAERDLMEAEAPGANVAWLPFPHDASDRPGHFAGRDGVAFIGGYVHRPNVDGVLWFLDEIWPLVRARMPDGHFYALGSDMPSSISDRRDPGFTAVGWVPDIAEWLGKVRVTVAPLRFGAGTKGKVLTSLAHGVPCVATPIAAEGLELTERQLIIRSDPAAFADAIVRLHESESDWEQVSAAGSEWIEEHHSLSAAGHVLDQVLRGIDAPVAQRESAA